MEHDSEKMILRHLLHTEPYARVVMPHLKEEYFANQANRAVFRAIEKYVNKSGSLPDKEVLYIELQNAKGVSQATYTEAKSVVDSLSVNGKVDLHRVEWLVNTTEEFVKHRALYLALAESAALIEKAGSAKPGEMSLPETIPDMLADALSVSFDKTVGHDYLEDFSARFDFYHSVEEQIPFDIDMLNFITKGGLYRKSLTTILAGTGVGKTLVMCHQAAFNLMCGKNVLYITLEMADKKIAERIDANLMDVPVDDLKTMDRESFDRRIARIREKTVGKLIVKEYPTASAGVLHFKALLKELKVKKNFVPDVIYVDYINLCVSSRYKGTSNVNSYTMVKAIAEELRGLAVEANVPVITATQTTRSGIGSSDVDMTDTSESIGLPFTVDLMYAIISTEDMSKAGHIMFKQLKNRYDDPNKMLRFMVGVDKSKMKLFNLEESAQRGLESNRKDSAAPQFPQKKSGEQESLSTKFKRFSGT